MTRPKFKQLNDGWNADPNAPAPSVAVSGNDVLLRFKEALNRAKERPVDQAAVTRALENRGYRSFHLGDGNRFSFHESSLRAAFHEQCNHRPPTRVGCDAMQNYLWDVWIDDYAYVNVSFLHKDGTEAAFLEGFACTNQGPGWECMAEH